MLIGIDLGTTNSLAAYFDGEKPVLIPNRLGEALTPSVVSVDKDGTVLVGRAAKERAMLDPFCSAAVFKRAMGTDKEFELSGKKFKAVELSSLVLRSLKEDAEAFLGEPVDEAIISVPAYFNDLQRKATRQAGEMAGFRVDASSTSPPRRPWPTAWAKSRAAAFWCSIWGAAPLTCRFWSWTRR